MRSPERIPRILKQIEGIWKAHPDLRLMQLLGNVFQAGDHYYEEDGTLEVLLAAYYEKVKP